MPNRRSKRFTYSMYLDEAKSRADVQTRKILRSPYRGYNIAGHVRIPGTPRSFIFAEQMLSYPQFTSLGGYDVMESTKYNLVDISELVSIKDATFQRFPLPTYETISALFKFAHHTTDISTGNTLFSYPPNIAPIKQLVTNEISEK